MRVKSPCPAAVGGGAAEADGVGPAAIASAAITSAEGVEKSGDAGVTGVDVTCVGPGAGSGTEVDAGVGAAAGALVNCASRSSSLFAAGAEGIPKMPVALDGEPPEGSSDWGEKSLPNRSLNASMQLHHVLEKIALFRNPRLHRLGLTVKSRQPRMQAHSMAARPGQVIAAWMIAFACASGCEPLNSYDRQTV
jgi:hypothetical protein